ncbi:hypothetical protein [Sorangium sp. So ce362]|uniref:WD40 repeat domain-containing protein n=1 Tax=Sorangium sp. So ce362 TaxID=3133303 RepID=UPI003F5E96FC
MAEPARLPWDRPVRAVGIGELPESLVKGVQPVDGPPLERAMVEFQIGSGSLLVRDAEGAFSFVHRSVLEWLVAEAADDKKVRVWEVESGWSLCVLEGHGNAVMSVAFNPGGQTLASGSGDSTVRLWEVRSGRATGSAATSPAPSGT